MDLSFVDSVQRQTKLDKQRELVIKKRKEKYAHQVLSLQAKSINASSVAYPRSPNIIEKKNLLADKEPKNFAYDGPQSYFLGNPDVFDEAEVQVLRLSPDKSSSDTRKHTVKDQEIAGSEKDCSDSKHLSPFVSRTAVQHAPEPTARPVKLHLPTTNDGKVCERNDHVPTKMEKHIQETHTNKIKRKIVRSSNENFENVDSKCKIRSNRDVTSSASTNEMTEKYSPVSSEIFIEQGPYFDDSESLLAVVRPSTSPISQSEKVTRRALKVKTRNREKPDGCTVSSRVSTNSHETHEIEIDLLSKQSKNVSMGTFTISKPPSKGDPYDKGNLEKRTPRNLEVTKRKEQQIRHQKGYKDRQNNGAEEDKRHAMERKKIGGIKTVQDGGQDNKNGRESGPPSTRIKVTKDIKKIKQRSPVLNRDIYGSKLGNTHETTNKDLHHLSISYSDSDELGHELSSVSIGLEKGFHAGDGRSQKTEKKSDIHLELSDTFQIKVTNNAPTYQPILQQRTIKSARKIDSVDPAKYPEVFVVQPAIEGVPVRCRISRDKQGMDRGLFPTYFLHLERDDGRRFFLLAARRRRRSTTSSYVISHDATDLSRYSFRLAGRLRANFLGTQFTIYDTDKTTSRKSVRSPGRPNSGMSYQGDFRERPLIDYDMATNSGNVREIAAVIYDSNVLGFKGPRKMTVIIPRVDAENQMANIFAKSDSNNLIDIWRKRDTESILELHNKTPFWNEDTQSYVLNFHGRVTQASVKNFQIVSTKDESKVIMQFGRVSDEFFNMDFEYPLCALQAFGIALSSFDGKLACE